MMIIENYKRDLDWVLSVLDSCETLNQIEIAENCYEQLVEKWGKSIPIDKFLLISELFEGEISFKKGLEEVKTRIYKKNLDNLSKN